MTTRRRVVSSALVALVMAGCTSGNDDAGPQSTTPTSTTPTVQADTTSNASTTVSPRAEATTEDGLPLPEGEEPEVLGPLGQSTVVIETEDGSLQIGAGTVPDVVSAEFPVPDDLVIELSSSAGGDAGFSGRSDSTLDELADFYATELPLRGFVVVDEQVVDGTVVVYEFDGPSGQGSVAISSAPGGGRSILVTFAR